MREAADSLVFFDYRVCGLACHTLSPGVDSVLDLGSATFSADLGVFGERLAVRSPVGDAAEAEYSHLES